MKNHSTLAYIHIFIISILTNSMTNAQAINSLVNDVVAPSANVAALGRYSDIPVGLFTGVPKISIPVSEVSIGSLSTSVSIDYHSAGIKVNQLSSSVGLGWSLSAGGMVSRTVMGFHDESGYFKCGSTLSLCNFWGPNGDYSCNLQVDGEPDLFNVQVGNIAAKFFYDKDGVIRFVDKSDLKIERQWVSGSSTITGFTLYDTNGDKYFFGNGNDEITEPYPYGPYKSAWYLYKIESADAKYVINMTYENEGYRFRSLASKSSVNFASTYNEVKIRGKRIKTITNGSKSITFNYNTDRTDVDYESGYNSRSLDEIVVSEGSFCKKYLTQYDYFVGNVVFGALNAHRRLRLLSIQEQSCDATPDVVPKYLFTYEGVNNSDGSPFLPNRLDKGQDHWGYNNGWTNNTGLFPPVSQWWVPTDNQCFDSPGTAMREVSEVHLKYGILKKISYPTGASNEFTYEANRVPYINPVGQELYRLQNCGTPFKADCCGNPKITESTMSFTQNQLNTGKVKMTLEDIELYYNQGTCTGSTSSFNMIYKITVFNNATNQQVGTPYQFNTWITPGSGNAGSVTTVNQNLSTFGLQANTLYRFKLEVIYGKGEFIVNGPLEYNRKAAGLRIKQIIKHDGISISNNIILNYEYTKSASDSLSSGVLAQVPLYCQSVFVFYPGDCNNGTSGYATPFGFENDMAVVPLNNYEGLEIGYARVIEKIEGNGYTENKFYASSNVYPNPFQLAPAMPSYLNSRLYEQNTFDQNNNLLQKKSIIPDNSITYTAVNTPAYRYVNLPPSNKLFNSYQIYTIQKRVKSEETTLNGVNTTTTYTYDPGNRFNMPVSKSVTNSDGKVHKEEYTYNHDYDNSTGLRDALVNKNIIYIPFRTVVKVDNVHVDGPETGNAWFNLTTGVIQGNGTGAHPRPYQMYRYEKTFDASGNLASTGGITLQATINSYDVFGNIKQVTKPNWDPENFEWFSNGLMMKRTFLNHSKEYTYHPGTQLLATSKDIDGQITYFDYDKLSRLSKIVIRKVGSTENVKTELTYHFKETTGDVYNWMKSKTTFTATANSSLVIRETKEIVDGFGRPIQTIKVNQSPNNKDVIFAKQYDNKGRLWKEYLPFESSGNTGAYMAIPVGTKFKETLYEASPLIRISSVTPPGGYATTYSYGANASTDVLNPLTGVNYSPDQLTKVVVTDPMNNRSIEFKDKKGRSVMTWRTDVSYSNHAKTYTVYDNKDRVSKVIPPGAVISNNNLVFAYTYDQDDKILSKTVPGKGLEKFIYNNKDQVTFTQDAKWVATKDWVHTKYDAYGRLLNSGRYTHNTSADPLGDLNATFTDQYNATLYYTLLTDGVKLGKIKQTKDKILGTSNYWIQKDFDYDDFGRVKSVTGNNHLYDNLSAETITNTYDFADNVMTENRIHKPSATSTEQINLNKRWTYDAAGRVKDHFTTLNGIETKITNQNYNFREELTEKNLGAVTSGGISTYLQSLDFSYNDQGLMTKINQPTLGGTNIAFPAVCTPSMPSPGAYTLATNPDGNDLFYMELNYDLNSTGITGLPSNSQKSGNLSQIAWRIRGRDRQAYNYTYDFMDRMTSSVYYDVNSSNNAISNNRYNESLTYDARGNITTLLRSGHYQDASNSCAYGTIDNLNYTYIANSNLLTAVTDNTTTTQAKPKGYNPGSGGSGYGYDEVGNLRSDTYKGITNITYNYLNLPVTISWGTTKSIDFVYDASGQKLSKTIKTGTTITSTQDYLMGIEYNKLGTGARMVESVYHNEGRYFNSSSTSTPVWRIEYSIKDHLGNTRLSFTDKNNDGKIDITGVASTNEILQENHYYSFGLAYEGTWMMNDAAKDNPYQYNDKELITDQGLNWSDYGARMMDHVLGRFTTVDPICGLENFSSVYGYAQNNPILYIDYMGLDTVKQIGPDTYDGGVPTSVTITATRVQSSSSIPAYYFFPQFGYYAPKVEVYELAKQNDALNRKFLQGYYGDEAGSDYLAYAMWHNEFSYALLATVEIQMSLFVPTPFFLGMGSGIRYASIPTRLGWAAKGGSQGGLNLFKWGAEQTGKSTGWKAGDYMLHLPNKGTPALNWKANYGALRSEMNLSKPIFDSYRLPNGNLIPTGGFLNAERFTLQSRGWIYNPGQRAWLPPIK